MQPADLASVLHCVATVTRAGYDDAMSSADTTAVVPGTFTIGAPAVTGNAATGSTLTCAAPGAALGAISYEWFRGTTSVGTGATYDVVAADVGSALRCVVTSVRAGYDDATNETSSAVVALGEFTVADPTITGTPKVGVPLTCAAPAGPGTASYAWRRGATALAATAGYTPVASDLGATLVCDLTVARNGYEDATSSADTAAVVSGTFTIGRSDDHRQRGDGLDPDVRRTVRNPGRGELRLAPRHDRRRHWRDVRRRGRRCRECPALCGDRRCAPVTTTRRARPSVVRSSPAPSRSAPR